MKSSLSFTLKGQLPSGKNRIIVTRTGHRFPDPKSRFPKWKDDVMKQIAAQVPEQAWIPITRKCRLLVDYTPGDHRVRDVPGLMDALLHVLEKSGVVKDDGLIRDCVWHEFPVDKARPLAIVTLEA